MANHRIVGRYLSDAVVPFRAIGSYWLIQKEYRPKPPRRQWRPMPPIFRPLMPRTTHRTATVTPCWLERFPTFTLTGTLSPTGTPGEIRALIWNSPGMVPGAAPAYSTTAGNPPIWTDTGATGLGSTSTAGRPSTPGGSVMPSPVPHRTTMDPGCAGAAGEFTVTPSSFRIEPCRVPLESCVNSPGAVALTAT